MQVKSLPSPPLGQGWGVVGCIIVGMNNGQAWAQGELQQSQIINQRFREVLRAQDISQAPSEWSFPAAEREVISARFKQLCQGERMSYAEFRRGLGLLGREDSFISRIFNLVDADADGFITEEDYLRYLGVILRGSELQRARLGWLILTEGRGEIELKDFLELFQEVSVVWNALTGEVVAPRRRYIEDLFNTFDVDQDQAITFNDYRLFFNEHLQLFGWFEYFNNIELSEQSSRAELQKVRDRLRSKLQLRPQGRAEEDAEELRLLMHDTERQIERKLAQLGRGLAEGSAYIRARHQEVRNAQQEEAVDLYSQATSGKSLRTGNTSADDDSLSLRSLYKYDHSQSLRLTPIRKIHERRRKIHHESRSQLGVEVAGELKGVLDATYRLMELCQAHRGYALRQQRFSPTRLKHMQAKLKLFDIHDQRAARQESQGQGQLGKMTVYFGHENWNLVLNIMVGLRQSIKALYELGAGLELREAHFGEQHEFFLGNKGFLSGKAPEALRSVENYKFIEMAPLVFERLRGRYGVANTDYQRSVGPEALLNQLLTGDLTALNEKCSTGKSGAFFYLTGDNRVFLKTIPQREFVCFTRMLRNYYEHMVSHPHSLIVRIYGLYKLKVFVNKQKVNTIYFISMENIFQHVASAQGTAVQEVYDLKGSLYGRTGSGDELKDQDWVDRGKRIALHPEDAALFREQVAADSRFFKKNNINDYSLMVAFVTCDPQDHPLPSGNRFKSLRGGIRTREPGRLLVLSIIDILTAFEALKNLEYVFKSTFLSKDVSCVPPSDYSHRFRDFILASVD